MRGGRGVWWLAMAGAIFVVATIGMAAQTYGPASVGTGGEFLLSIGLFLPAVALGVLVHVRAPSSPVGPALAWMGAIPALVFAVEGWGATYFTDDPWWGARPAAIVAAGVWTWLFMGFVGLVLVFPSGLLPGRRWRVVAATAPVSALLLNVVISTDISNFTKDPAPPAGRTSQVSGEPPFVLPDLARAGLIAVALAFFLLVLLAVAASLVIRFRRGDERTRLQLRWLMYAALSVPLLVAAGWLLEALGASITMSYVWFLVAMLVLVPAAVAVAILRHDLFDVDRLLGGTLAWVVTTAGAAAIFAGAVLAVAYVFPSSTEVGLAGAAFVTALVLLPLHRVVHTGIGRLVDRDRTVLLTAVRDFVAGVRDGRAEPEQVEHVLRSALHDPELRVLVRGPGSAPREYVDLRGEPVRRDSGAATVALRSAGSEVGVLVLGVSSARRLRQAREAAREARLPIEVSWLRLELRQALGEVRASRSRLVLSTVAERRRLERDLHDGAQQQLIAIGMRLRSVQRQLDARQPAHGELDQVVEGIEHTVAELRRLAHGLRPSRLDDGLGAALRHLVQESAVPVELAITDLDVPDVAATTAYFVVAEAVAKTR